MVTLRRRAAAAYGADPLHLLALLACFALAGYAAYRASLGPLPIRMLVWFGGAVIGHDLVLYPLYALADRSLLTLRPRRHRRSRPADGRPLPSAVNHIRVPALLSGLLLLMFSPVIFRQGEGAYRAASGLSESPYLARWLLITGALFAASAVVYAIRIGRIRKET